MFYCFIYRYIAILKQLLCDTLLPARFNGQIHDGFHRRSSVHRRSFFIKMLNFVFGDRQLMQVPFYGDLL